MKYLIANWKAELNKNQVDIWLDEFIKNYQNIDKLNIIICPPLPYLSILKDALLNFKNVYLGAQTTSSFKEGPYTGEVTASMIKDFADFVIVGHSERRTLRNEINEDIIKQLKNARLAGLQTILCVRDELDIINSESDMIAYEPLYAIGTGIQPKIQDILKIKNKLKNLDNKPFIYGGSIDEVSLAEYLQSNEVDGFLVGKYSTSFENFNKLLKIF